MKTVKALLRELREDAPVLLSVAALCGVGMAFTGMWPTKDNPYNTYALQAQAWLSGRLDLGQDVPWLELAVYHGRYYVSFPPFPSFVLLPLCLIWGVHTPDHFITLALAAVSAVYALRLYRAIRRDRRCEGVWALFLLAGNGFLNLCLQGWVWHMAQAMCFALSLMSVYYALCGRGGASLACWACAIGCRPMVAAYLPFLAALLWQRRADGETRFGAWIRAHLRWGLAPLLLAAAYMGLNAARFGNPLEFGHDYLPEFTRAELGQFHIGYFLGNLRELFRLPEVDAQTGALRFYTFGAQAVWAITPMTAVFALLCLRRVFRRGGRPGAPIVLLILSSSLHLFVILCHRTLGGWQFGNRYLVDMLPYLFCGALLLLREEDPLDRLMAPILCGGALVNLVGMIATYNHWI